MNTDQLKELLTVIECGSLTAAAQKLGYTLSGISRSMSALEKELGLPLLYRQKSGVQPTKECLRLLPDVHELLFYASRLEQNCASIKGIQQGVIRIGTAYRHYYRWLTEITRQFHQLHPQVKFRIFHGTSTDFARQLSQHQLDFCLISRRQGTHAWYPMCRDPLVAVLPLGHPLTEKSEIPLAAFGEEAYIETCPGLDIDTSRFFRKQHFQPNTQFSTMDIQATYAMVDAGLGISITNQINSLSEYSGVCHRPLEKKETIEIGLACADGLPPAALTFLHYMLPQLPRREQDFSRKSP